ncbi:unnamed protein product, partial [marine sediment metagenome]
VRKKTICKDLDLKLVTVNRACRILRKNKDIGMYYRIYWGAK